ncbi:MAG TPA: DUF4214 domain-containing protein, partial [Gemmataceae bacterium]|nr:DUF4214 domain-containing protein [Gemmataceae bacterium]
NITVLLVNQPPTFTPGPNVTVLEDSGASAAAWATNLGPGAPNENGQVLNFIVTGNSNPGLFAAGPTFDAAGDLFFTPAANANGVASIFVVLHDNGGTVNGGNDTSAQVVFTIAVTPVNDQPSFTAGPNVGVFEDSGAYAAPWASNISTGPANENNEVVTFQVVGDSNPALFAAPPFVDQAGNLFFTPAANANGSAVITVQMLDDGGTANGGANLTAPQTFTIFVVPVNDAPSFTPGPTVSVLQSGGPQTFPGWATDLLAGPPDEAGQGLSFVVLGNSNPAVIANVTLDAAGNLTVTPAAGAVGSAVITVALKDNGDTANGGVDTSAPVSFTVTIIAINQPPSFFRGPDVSATRDAGLVVLPGWAAGIVAGPPNEAGQAVDFIVSNNNPTLFLVQPTVAPDGTLTFAPTGAGGSAIVTVQLHDNGGTANGGIDTSAPQQFTITVSGTGFRGTPNEAYVVETYFDLLDRIISPGDLAFWVDQLEADVPRLTIATQIVNSPEYRSKQIAHLYQSLLNKDPSPADLFPHLQYLGAGHTSEELRSVFLSSPAYIHGHGQSNEFAWVNAIFMDEFGHGANLSGQQYWVTQLRNSGYDFFNTALAIITTPEGYGTVVRQLYVNLLGHPVDPSAGLNPWFVALQNGMRDEDVIAGINSSLEYFQHQSPHWSVPGLQSWVSHMYVDTLGRVVDPNGLSFWVGAMERGASRIDIMQQVVHSGEFLTHEINNVYQQLLHRAGDPAGINIGLQLLGSGGTVEQLKAQLMGSAEYYFVRGGGTDAGFLTSVLSDALSMPPAQAFAGVGFWANVLAGTTRDNVALQILTDPNAEQALVQNMYFSLLRRSGGAGLAYWAGQIEAGMRDESVIANLVASREYYTKFSAG